MSDDLILGATIATYLTIATCCALIDRWLVMESRGRRSWWPSVILGILWPLTIAAYTVALVAYIGYAMKGANDRRRRSPPPTQPITKNP